jgi:multidrug efflux pump subunit AcrA (membrane-fusion protein)
MPARTSAKKTMPSKKPAAAKKPARPARSVADKPRQGNGAQAKARAFAGGEALHSESDQLRQQLRQKEELLQLGQVRIAGLEHDLEDARKTDRPAATLEQQLRELQARFTTRQAELEAARSEAQNLREAVAKARVPGEAGNLPCPRCGGKMTEQLLEQVRADRCGSCHGIFFDNGELEIVIKHHDQQRDAGKRHWYSGIFGKRG